MAVLPNYGKLVMFSLSLLSLKLRIRFRPFFLYTTMARETVINVENIVEYTQIMLIDAY